MKEQSCYTCIHLKVCKNWAEIAGNPERLDLNIGCTMFKATDDVAEVRHGQIKWVNRPISAQYATVTGEYGEKHYGKVCDRIENNPVGYCGECGKRIDDTFMNYCPNCGADMRGTNDGT